MIQIKFPGADPTEGGWVMHELDHVPGRRLQYYLRDARLIGLSRRCHVVEESTQKKLRLSDAPVDGACIVLRPAGRAES